MSSDGSARVVIIAFFGNLGIAVAKFAGAGVTGSAALFAEAIHSLVDTSNQLLLLIGHRAADKPPSAEHPLGFGREAFFWSFLVAMLLFSMGGVFAIYEGFHKLRSPEPLTSPLVGLAILLVSLCLEGYSYRACLKEVRLQNTYGSLWAWFRHAAAAELLVVFMEDTAALLGLSLAVASLGLTWWTGQHHWDAIGSILIGCVLVVVAVLLAVEIKSLLVGEAPTRDYRAEIEALAREEIPSASILRFIAVYSGASEVLVSYKLTHGGLRDVDEFVAAIDRIEKRVKERFPEIRWQFVEPDHEP